MGGTSAFSCPLHERNGALMLPTGSQSKATGEPRGLEGDLRDSKAHTGTLAHTLLVRQALQLDPPLRVTHARPSGNGGDFPRRFGSHLTVAACLLEVPLGGRPPEDPQREAWRAICSASRCLWLLQLPSSFPPAFFVN